jgi:hypothetical protein
VTPEGSLRAAEVAAAEGETERVAQLFAGVEGVALGPEEAWRWLLLLVEAGHVDTARGLAERLRGSPLEARAAEMLADEAPPEEPDDGLLDAPEGPPRRPEQHAREVDLFLRWFGGRRDLYARQWYDEKRRRSGYHPVEEPLTAAVARAHLDGRLTAGQYLLHPDATVSYGVLDLDLDGDALAELRAAHGPEASPLLHDRLRAHARRLVEAAASLGLPLWPEDSGGRGVHLWLLLDPRRPARAARAALAQVLVSAGPQPPEVRVEIFPKQDRLGRRGLSSLVKLPLGVHQVTLRRCPLLDDELRPIEDLLAALERLRAALPDALDAVIGRRVLPLPAAEIEPPEPLPPLPREMNARSLAEALRAIPAGRESDEACERMMAGCAVLRRLVRRAFEERRLSAAEAGALVYTVGLVGPSCRLVDEAFAAAQVARKELERARRGLSAPTGCRRLRQVDPEGAAECRCPSGEEALPYSTPALFAVGARAPSPPSWAPFAPWVEDDAVPPDPLRAIADQLRRMEERLARIEEKSEDRKE